MRVLKRTISPQPFSARQWEMRTFRIPPAVSLPKQTRPAACPTRQLRITTFSVGRSTRRPSPSRPAFKQMASSSHSISQPSTSTRSEEHTYELQSHSDLVCRLLLEKKKT